MSPQRYLVGHGAIVPLPFCLACGAGLGAIEGQITGHEGPDYVIRLDHRDDRSGRSSCNTAGVGSVWTQAEIDALTWLL